ncbi:MAG: hypothetical protein C4575_06640 [Desulforudis sp.]|jgi:hypothetical protein|nr:MAG: hypothetical protein C4575_06640 [Desulforudis sp.]
MKARLSLYPDILFHFTTKESLWGILSQTFSVSYSREKIVGGKRSTEFYAPMVSFCDLKVSELKDHMKKYGNYGIGLTKNWANKKGLNPVFYVNKHSPFTSNFIRAVEDLKKHIEHVPGILGRAMAEGTYDNILTTYSYIKNYEGDLERRNGTKTRNYRFADEREWRFIPPIDSEIPPFLTPNKIRTDEDKEHYNNLASAIKLRFAPEDIKYLIIETDEEIMELIHHLDDAKMHFPDETKRRLMSRILTAEQINKDI